jgi:hypothetical protein
MKFTLKYTISVNNVGRAWIIIAYRNTRENQNREVTQYKHIRPNIHH